MNTLVVICAFVAVALLVPECNATSFQMECGDGEESRECPGSCPEICGRAKPHWCTYDCGRPCVCKPGYIRSGSRSGPCIPLSQCERLPWDVPFPGLPSDDPLAYPYGKKKWFGMSCAAARQRMPVVKYKVGDQVRVLLNHSMFHEGYTGLWSPDVFVISRIRYANPTIVYLTERNGQEISGGWYLEDVQKVGKPVCDKWPTGKSLEMKMINDVLPYLVRWFGYETDYDGWVVASNIRNR